MTQGFRDLFEQIRLDQTTPYGLRMKSAAEASDRLLSSWGKPAMKAGKVAAIGVLGAAALTLGPLALTAGALSLVDDVLLLGGASLAYRMAGGWPGLLKMGAGTVKGLGESIRFGGGALEKAARFTLIGGVGKGGRPWEIFGKGTSALDVWFPHLKGGYAKTDLRRWSLNTRVMPRLALLAGGFGIAKGALGAMGEFTGSAPGPVTAYYDGSNVRHANDMGADASYARSILGRNSGL